MKQIFDGQLIEEIIKLGALADILRLLRHGLTVGAKELNAVGRSQPPFLSNSMFGRPRRDLVRDLLLEIAIPGACDRRVLAKPTGKFIEKGGPSNQTI